MQDLLKATPEMVSSVRGPLLDARNVPDAFCGGYLRVKNVLKILLGEIKLGVRYGTVSWVMLVVENEATAARARGCDGLADELYRAADALLEVLRALDEVSPYEEG